MRAEFQVLVIPFIREPEGKIKYAVFKRSDGKYWQFIAGGGDGVLLAQRIQRGRCLTS